MKLKSVYDKVWYRPAHETGIEIFYCTSILVRMNIYHELDHKIDSIKFRIRKESMRHASKIRKSGL